LLQTLDVGGNTGWRVDESPIDLLH
jgi:hypothetical protein